MANEATARWVKRHIAFLAARLNEIDYNRITDPRRRVVKWPLEKLIRASMVGMITGCKGLAELEELTGEISRAARRRLKLLGRLPDTTLHDVLVELQPDEVRQRLHDAVRSAHRRKQLSHDLPVRAVAMDGKATATRLFDEPDAPVRYGQQQGDHAVVRTVTSCLMSAPGRPCIDAHPVPPRTNEDGCFIEALDTLLATYGRTLFDVVLYDAGACSLKNATAIVERDLDYVFCLTAGQPTLLAEAQRLLGGQDATQAQHSETTVEGGLSVTRRVWLSEEMAQWLDWTHLQTVVRVERVWKDSNGEVVRRQDRYYMSSLRSHRLKPREWAQLIRRRWSVENNNHNILDRIWQEDDRPWLLVPRGMVVSILLRRLSYTLLTLFRSVTLRSESNRQKPWKSLLKAFERALYVVDEAMMQGVRDRRRAAG